MDPELDIGMDHVQALSVQTSRLLPALRPVQARLCLREKFARKNRPAASTSPGGERERGPRMVNTL